MYDEIRKPRLLKDVPLILIRPLPARKHPRFTVAAPHGGHFHLILRNIGAERQRTVSAGP